MKFIAYLRSIPPHKWASLLLGLGMVCKAGACWISGDTTNAWGYLVGAFGTVGVPSIFGPGYQITVTKAEQGDLTPPRFVPEPPVADPPRHA